MRTRSRVPLDVYADARPLLRHVRVMERVMDFVDGNPEMRPFYAELREAYTDILRDELAPSTADLAIAPTTLEDAFPEIVREVGR